MIATVTDDYIILEYEAIKDMPDEVLLWIIKHAKANMELKKKFKKGKEDKEAPKLTGWKNL